MSNSYESIDEALNIESSIVESQPMKPVPPKVEKDDIKKDYEYTRANLYSVIEKRQEAINQANENATLAREKSLIDSDIYFSKTLRCSGVSPPSIQTEDSITSPIFMS